jgi:ribonuclease HI
MRAELSAEIYELESELLNPATRANRDRLHELLHDDFVEVGKSGRQWDKQSCIEMLLAETESTTQEITSFILESLHADGSIVMAHWTMPGVRRVSVWVFESTHWQMRYHQGTHSFEV